MRQDEQVGETTIEEAADWPWLNGRFAAGPAFPDLEPLFVQELALMLGPSPRGGAARTVPS
ncbi:hypothetical protein NE235_15110, partial [Actinoallomurus spadix]